MLIAPRGSAGRFVVAGVSARRRATSSEFLIWSSVLFDRVVRDRDALEIALRSGVIA
ncbi:hypothetical protein MCBRY_003029 [Methylocystis bryophila]